VSGRRKGIILAGGAGTRLHPLTFVTSKQLLPVYDKPMIYYPLTTLMLGGITDILVITTPHDATAYQLLLADGSQWGLSFQYAIQERPEGIGQALIIGRTFLEGSACALVLGDNIFYGDGLSELLQRASSQESGATVFAYWVDDPQRYGIVEFDRNFNPVRLVEKPAQPKSNFAITGMYFYDERAPELACELQPSNRGEIEITDLNRRYLDEGRLIVERLGRGYAWLDAGTHDSLLESAQFIRIVERRQGLKIACPEEVAFRMGLIDAGRLAELAQRYKGSAYGQYLRRQLDEPVQT